MKEIYKTMNNLKKVDERIQKIMNATSVTFTHTVKKGHYPQVKTITFSNSKKSGLEKEFYKAKVYCAGLFATRKESIHEILINQLQDEIDLNKKKIKELEELSNEK